MSCKKPVLILLSLIVIGWANAPSDGLAAKNEAGATRPECYFFITKATTKKDLTNDGRSEIINFKLGMSEDEKNFVSIVEILAAPTDKNDKTPEVLWKASHIMSFEGMGVFLGTEGGMSLCDWVKRCFSGSLGTGAVFRKTKLQPRDIEERYLEEFAAKNGTNKQETLKMILEQKENSLLVYPKEWETYVQLVYLPKLHKFVQLNQQED